MLSASKVLPNGRGNAIPGMKKTLDLLAWGVQQGVPITVPDQWGRTMR